MSSVDQMLGQRDPAEAHAALVAENAALRLKVALLEERALSAEGVHERDVQWPL